MSTANGKKNQMFTQRLDFSDFGSGKEIAKGSENLGMDCEDQGR